MGFAESYRNTLASTAILLRLHLNLHTCTDVQAHAYSKTSPLGASAHKISNSFEPATDEILLPCPDSSRAARISIPVPIAYALAPLAPLAPFPKTFSRGNAPVATNACMLQQPAPESTMNQANWPGHRLKISEHWEKQCQTTWQKETFTTIIWGICVLPLRRYALYSPFLTEPG